MGVWMYWTYIDTYTAGRRRVGCVGVLYLHTYIRTYIHTCLHTWHRVSFRAFGLAGGLPIRRSGA